MRTPRSAGESAAVAVTQTSEAEDRAGLAPARTSTALLANHQREVTMKFNSGRVVGACTLTALVAGAAVAAGAIPGTDGSVHACYATGNGLLLGIPYSKGDIRAVDQGEACRSYEKPISWNQTGPPGKDGSAVAYAHVFADGTLDAANSNNVTVVSHSTGHYCLATSVPVHVVAATLEQTEAGATIHATAHYVKSGVNCPTSVEIVELQNPPNDVQKDLNFASLDASFDLTFN
jgi:hypothetical protein